MVCTKCITLSVARKIKKVAKNFLIKRRKVKDDIYEWSLMAEIKLILLWIANVVYKEGKQQNELNLRS